MIAGVLMIIGGIVCAIRALTGIDNGPLFFALGALAVMLGFGLLSVLSRVGDEAAAKLLKGLKNFFYGMLDCNLPEAPDNSTAPAFFRKLNALRPLYDWTYRIVLFICKLLLIGDIFVTSWAVLGRYIPFISDPHWSEEIVLTFMAYMAVLSATLAIRKRSHIRMTAFDNKLPPVIIKVLDVLADLCVMALGVVLIIYGIRFCNSPLSLRGKYASLPNLSKVWQYLPIPVAGFSMVVFELEQVFQHVESFFIKEEPRKEGIEA